LPTEEAGLPPPCADDDGDRDGDGRVTNKDLVEERDCLAHRDGVLDDFVRGFIRWWKAQGAPSGQEGLNNATQTGQRGS
jgi:hypothetical protein